MEPQVLYAIVSVAAIMHFAFILAIFLKNNSIVDIFWGLGFALVAIVTYVTASEFNLRMAIATVLVCTWGFRLVLHIYLRNRGKGEDFRYKAWRESWGKYFYIRSYLQIFILQGVLMLIVSSGIILINTYSGLFRLNIIDLIGIGIWIIGFSFEAIGDYQLTQFVARKKQGEFKKNAIMTTGLWKYSRHPNYFGEATLWWGIFLIALSVSYGYLALISPLLIDFLLLKVSGVPMLEKKYENNKEFQKYKKVTRALIPLPK